MEEFSGKKFEYVSFDGKTAEASISTETVSAGLQAMKDYGTSKKFVESSYYWTWRYAMKAYHLSTHDRAMKIEKWQHNVCVGIVRAFVDVLVSSVQERPITFIATPVNQKGQENKDSILRSLNYVSDVTRFHRTIKQSLKNGLIVGTVAMRVNYVKTKKKMKVTSIIDGEAHQYVREFEDDEIADYPNATVVPIFNLFPDPYGGRLRYVTERIVLDHGSFVETFGNLIRNRNNKSELKSESFVSCLPMNPNGADLTDHGSIVTQIHQKANDESRAKDSYRTSNGQKLNYSNANGASTPDEDADTVEGLIECLYTTYQDRIVLHANGYPVYVGTNPYGFIPYVIKASGDDEMRFGEGIPYMMRGLGEAADSSVNSYFDSARAIANPTFVVVKNLLIDEEQLESGEPGGFVYVEQSSVGNPVSRLDKGGLQDFNVNNIVTAIGQQLTGVTEYALGQSAGERTASGALAVVQGSNKRVAPYVSSFVDAMSAVAQMWLSLMRKYWTEERYIYVLDEQGNQTFQLMQNHSLIGAVNISLQAEGLFGSTNELELQKLLSVYQTLAPSGFMKSSEFAGEILKKSGFTPSRFIIETDQLKPDGIGSVSGDAGLSDMLKAEANPQIDLGNGGEGRQ